MKPSFMSSTLSLMSVVSLLSIIAFVVMKIEVPDFAQQVLAGIIWAYIGSRIPGKQEAPYTTSTTVTASTTTPEAESITI